MPTIPAIILEMCFHDMLLSIVHLQNVTTFRYQETIEF